MHLHRNPGVLQRNVVNQRVVYIIDLVILILQQECGRRLASDRNIWIQLEFLIVNPKMSRIKSHGEIGAAAFFVGHIDSRIQAMLKMCTKCCRQMPAC
jgi:hypothetical protein